MTNPSVNYEAKKRIVQAGESRICNNWVEHTDITPQDFLDALEWVCEDPFDDEVVSLAKLALSRIESFAFKFLETIVPAL